MYRTWIIVALIALSPVVNFFVYPVIVLFCIYLLYKGRGSEIVAGIKGDKQLCLFLAAALVSAIFSKRPALSAGASFILLMQVIFYFYVRKTALPDRGKVVNMLLVAGGIVAVIGIIQYFFIDISVPSRWIDKSLYNPGEYKRVFSTFINPNVLAGYLIFVISISFSNLPRKDALVVLPLAVSCLYFTFSRGGWLGTCTAVGAVFLLKRDWRILKPAAAVVCGVVFLGGWQSILDRAAGVLKLQDTTFLYRIEIWKTAINLFRENMLTGCGLGTAWTAIPQASPRINALVGHAHNLYLQFAVETGIIGTIAFITFYFSRIARALKRLNSLQGDERNLVIGLVGGFIGTAFHGIVDAAPVAPQLGIVIWMLMGLMEV